jgi:hypothetical protein
MLQSGLASSATLDVPCNLGRARLKHFGEKSAIPLRPPRWRRKQALFQLPKLQLSTTSLRDIVLVAQFARIKSNLIF